MRRNRQPDSQVAGRRRSNQSTLRALSWLLQRYFPKHSGFGAMPSTNKTGAHRASVPIGIGRALGGALVFSLPMLMTMEMWELGFYMDRMRLALLLLSSFPMLMFLSHYSGFERTWSWKDDLRDVFLAYGVGIFASSAIMLVLGLLDLRMSWSEILGKTALQVVPAALGALLARSQLGQDSQDGHANDSYGAELGVMAIGALFLSLNVAPTEEMVLIAYHMSAWHSLALISLSIFSMHGFVYAAGFNSGGDLSGDDPWWSLGLRFTLVGYALGLAIALYCLWTFSRLDGLSLSQLVAATIVLGFPASIGAAAARLIL